MQHEFHSVRDLSFKAIEAEIFNKFCLVIFSQTTKLYWWLRRSLFSVPSLPFLFDSFIYIYIFSSALYTGDFHVCICRWVCEYALGVFVLPSSPRMGMCR